jgi:hypothetical protein
MFVAEPLAAKGLPMARAVADTLVLAVLVIVVMFSRRWNAIILILLGLAAIVANFLLSGGLSPVFTSFATTFASAYALIWELSPGSFANLVAQVGGPQEVGTMLYFSLTTLTATGYGDIVAVDPFARSLAKIWRR